LCLKRFKYFIIWFKMKKILCFVSLLFASVAAYSQWKSSDIPDSLKRNADVVIRRYATDVRILSLDKQITTINKVVTVLNEQGKDFAEFREYYDRNSRIESIKVILYNDFGKVVKKYYIYDFSDVSIMPSFTLYDDSRMKYLQIYPLTYPYTVEYESKIVENNILLLPTWYPQLRYRMAVENSSLRVTLSDSNMIRCKSFNISPPIEEKDENYSKVWEVTNLKAIEKEPYSPNAFDFLPAVFMSPNEFVFEGKLGNMQSWQSYGEWVSRLLIGRQDLSRKAKTDIQNLVKGVTDVKEKVRIVYKYMQSQTRYVGIQLGIGGFQPFPASDVEKNGYGDCKALSNYTSSLLDTIGIKSYYCEIGVGNTRINFKDFPSISQTDHIIVCVPIDKDTIWLECTSQNDPFGYVSHVKQGQKVLLVNGLESRLVNTPGAIADKNVQARTIVFKLDSLGDGSGKMKTSVSGAELENLMPEIWSSKKEQAEIIQRKYRIPGIIFNEYEYHVEDSSDINASETLSFKVKGFASQTGRRLFVPFNPFVQKLSVPSKSKKRLTKVFIDESYTHIDTLKYSLPRGFSIEFLPKTKTISNKFGLYSTSASVDGDKVIVIRKYQQNRGKYDAKEFNNLVDFLFDVSRQDNQSLVLIKN